MTPRERILAALQCKPTDIVAFDLSGTKTTSMSFQAEEKLKAFLGIEAPTVWGNYRVHRVHMSEEMSRFFDVDVRRVGGSYPEVLPPEVTSPIQVDEWGVEWMQTPTGSYMPNHAAPPLANATLEELKSYPWPNPETWQPTEVMAAKAHKLRQEADYAICIDLPDAVVQFSGYLRGFEQWLVDTVLDPKFTATMMGYINDIYVAMVKHVMSAIGENADLVIIPDDLGGQNGLLLSPDAYRKFIKPLHARVFDAVRAHSPARILLHSCGAVSSIIADFIDIGVDGLNPVQVSAAGMQTDYLKREFGGKICFWGAVDSQRVLPSGTPDDVRDEVKRRIDDLAQRGGYVIAPVHIIQPEVPPENILALAEAAHVYGGRSDGSRFRPERLMRHDA